MVSGVADETADKGMEEFVATKLAPDTGGFASIVLRMTHDQFAELLSYVVPFIRDD